MYLFVPALISQVKDFVAAAPEIFNDITEFVMNIIRKFDPNSMINAREVKKGITDTIVNNFDNIIMRVLYDYLYWVLKEDDSGDIDTKKAGKYNMKDLLSSKLN